jgi:hypothetical protein
MLARTEEELQAGMIESLTVMTAVHTLLEGFFDYAGLYPPAGLDIRTAASRYLEYACGERAWALGRFIVNADRLAELRATVSADDLRRFKLSVIVSNAADAEAILKEVEEGSPIDTVEIKWSKPSASGGVIEVPESLTTYLEIQTGRKDEDMLDLIAGLGVRAKIRMGGVVAEAFPDASSVADVLSMLANRRLCFKATAGLHHPIRSSQRLTYEPESTRATMHGFLNLFCAAAAVYFGEGRGIAEDILQDEDRAAWQIDEGSLRWRKLSWTTEQIATVRREFFISVGSCSFEEPMRDLEELGWL